MSSLTVLVTGATGCVGRAVVAGATRAGWRVHGLARRAPAEGWPAEVGGFLGDVRDPVVVRRAAAGCDAVVHLAGWVHRSPRDESDIAELRTSIVDGTRLVSNVVRATGARLVVASSVAVFGAGSESDAPPNPSTPYGRAKLEAEEVARTTCPGALIMRPVLVYGPHDRGNVARLIRLIHRRLGVVVGDGTNRKAVVYVDNLADRVVAAMERTDLAGTWTVADDPTPTQAELVEEIARALRRPKPLALPRWPVDLAAAAIDRLAGTHWAARVASLTRSTEFSGLALDRSLGYAPRVPWPEGIRRQVERWKSA